MKKIIVFAVSVIVTLTLIGPASAVSDPLSSTSEITVISDSKNFMNPKVFALANGSAWITWQEETSGVYYQKARTVSPTNELGTVQTINSTPAISLDSSQGVLETVSINRSGKLFVVWVTQGLRYGVQSQKIWGRTSTDGVTWSKAFVVVPGLTVSGDSRMCEMDPSRFAGCGYTRLYSAIDNKGRLAVLTADTRTTIGSLFRLKATNLKNKWSNFKTLAAVQQTRSAEIVGLTSGFAASVSKYGFATKNGIRASYYDPKTEAWIKTLTAVAVTDNTVFNAHWVQRDYKNLTLAIAGEDTGVTYRNFNVDSKTWSSDLVEVQSAEAETVYQDVMATKVGSDLVILFPTYNRIDSSNEVRTITVSGNTVTKKVINSGIDETHLLYLGTSADNRALVGINVLTTADNARFGGTTDDYLPQLLLSSAANGYLSDMTKTKTDQVLAIGLKFQDSTTSIILVKGNVK